MLFFISAQAAPGPQGHTTTWWSWEQNFQVDFLLNICKSHQIISSTTMLKLFQESTKSWLKSSYQILTNIMLTLHYTSLSRMSSSPSLPWLFSYFRCEATELGLKSAQMQFLMLRNPSHMSLSTSNPLWEAQKKREWVMITWMRMKKIDRHLRPSWVHSASGGVTYLFTPSLTNPPPFHITRSNSIGTLEEALDKLCPPLWQD